MTARKIRYALSRKKVWIPALFGAGLLLGKLSMFWGIGLMAFAVLSATRLLANRELDKFLRLREDKRRHGIRRMLTPNEREEILAVDRYSRLLVKNGGDSELAQDTLDQAWEIIREGGHRDTCEKLRRFRHRLPSVDGALTGTDKQPQLNEKLERELEILHATKKEMDSLGPAVEPEVVVN